jgi:hypothetical protein
MTDTEPALDTDRSATGGPTGRHDPIPSVVDWLLGLVAGALGLALAALGGGLYARVDRALIADAVATEEVQVEGLTPSEFVTAATPFVDWLAIGVLLTGTAFVVCAAGFVVARRRTRRRVAHEGGTTATFWACAVYGATAAALLSFVPGSSAVGGGVAAYLHDGESDVRTGATAGLIGAVPTAPLAVFTAVGLFVGADAVGELAGGALLVGLLVVAELVALAIGGALGALGGVLVGRFA